jgi:flagellar protein FlaG
MSVNAVKDQSVSATMSTGAAPAERSPARTMGDSVSPGNEGAHKSPTKENLEEALPQMNTFMQSLNADIQFAIHEGTQQLMVRVVDVTDGRVLKEFPSHEFLDMMSRIRDYVGILLDKRV